MGLPDPSKKLKRRLSQDLYNGPCVSKRAVLVEVGTCVTPLNGDDDYVSLCSFFCISSLAYPILWQGDCVHERKTTESGPVGTLLNRDPSSLPRTARKTKLWVREGPFRPPPLCGEDLEDKRATTNVQNGLVVFFLFSFKQGLNFKRSPGRSVEKCEKVWKSAETILPFSCPLVVRRKTPTPPGNLWAQKVDLCVCVCLWFFLPDWSPPKR